MKKKLNLKSLKVKSFVTSIEKESVETVKGGDYNTNPRRCNKIFLTDGASRAAINCLRTINVVRCGAVSNECEVDY